MDTAVERSTVEERLIALESSRKSELQELEAVLEAVRGTVRENHELRLRLQRLEGAQPLAMMQDTTNDENTTVVNPAAADQLYNRDPDIGLEAALGAETVRLLHTRFVSRQEKQRVRDASAEQSDGATMEAATLRMLARLSEAPANYHQATIYFLQAGDEAGSAWTMLVMSGLIVLFQCMTATAIFVGADVKACSSQDQCRSGTFCGQQRLGFGAVRCYYCADSPLDPEVSADGTILNLPPTEYDFVGERFGGFNLTKVESLCADPRLDHPYFGTERSANAAQTVQALINWCHACRYNDGSVNPKGWFRKLKRMNRL